MTPVPGHRTKRGLVRACRQAAALLIASCVMGLASCSDGSPPGTTKEAVPSSPASESTGTATLSTAETQARKDAIAAYMAMTAEQVKAYAQGSLKGSQITRYATGMALRDTKDTVFVNSQSDIIMKGEPKVTASEEDVELSLDGSPPRATLQVCFDMNTWKPIYKASGKSAAPPNQAKRYMITAKVKKQGDLWLVTDEAADKERTC